MIHPQLRLAAAKFALDLAEASDLVDASHAALDDAIYADGLAVIATTPNMPFWEAKPHFAAALRELDHLFASRDDALRLVRLSYFTHVAEENGDPTDALQRYAPFDNQRWYDRLSGLDAWEVPSSLALLDHWHGREYGWHDQQIELGVTDPAESDRAWEAKAIALCREWCREYARLHLQPAWRSPTVVALASAIHAERAFDRLPILADALEEAGCDHPDLLAHCRHSTPHTDYCWLVDAVVNAG